MKDFSPYQTRSLFDELPASDESTQTLGTGAIVLRSFALPRVQSLLSDLSAVIAQAPFRHMVTPGGFEMSVAMTNCGKLGWISDRKGYRYAETDPTTGQRWPDLPESFGDLATKAATAAGYGGFLPDACLINFYEPGARLTLHQDRNEQDLKAPIVSVSLGLPATFQFGGLDRGDPLQRVRLYSGDVVVWGGASRLAYHGVLPLPDGEHSHTGRCRINLTFRKAA